MGLVWEEGVLLLCNNKNRSLRRRNSLVKILEGHSQMHKTCDTVMQEQIQNKIIERVSNSEICSCKGFIFPIKPSSGKTMTLPQNVRHIFY